ncbi:hypothetical protein MPSEU_000901300 [Mayamaea pseudoterrestris]|nr:hypothetical protein MPSEU_000901300 [Mayamaea pseudoterrestris]
MPTTYARILRASFEATNLESLTLGMRESLVVLHTSIDRVSLMKEGRIKNMEAGEQSKRGVKRPNSIASIINEQPVVADDTDIDKSGVIEDGSLTQQAQSTHSSSTNTISDDAQSASAARDELEDRSLGGSPGHHLATTTCDGSNAMSQDELDEYSSHMPLHRSGSEHEALELEAALRFHHNRRVLLSRLDDTVTTGRLCMINLARRNLSPAEAPLIATAIQANPQLTELKLCYNLLGDAGAHIIATALRNNAGQPHGTLLTLDLGFNEIGDVGCDAIAVAGVTGNYIMRSLYLTGNKIKKNGALSLARAILHGTGLTSLYLSANTIGSTGMTAIALAVARNDERLASPEAYAISTEAPSRRMENLHLSATLANQDGFEAIAGLVLSTASLKALCLSGNNIDDHDMVLLSHALAQNKSIPLESIRLGYNHITCQGVECFMNAIWGSSTLREVMLNHNKLQDRGAQLCAVVLTSISLRILDLSFNRVTTVGIKAIMKNLSENATLHSLSLCGIPIDLNASKAVSYALAYNSSLRELYLDNCSTGYSSQRHIVAGVVSNRRSSLSVLTGFAVGPVAMTLGMPQLPSGWTNAQVLRFFQTMWKQWLLKSGRGAALTDEQVVRGPAPPAAVAAAAKIALAAIGSSDANFPRVERDKLMTERPPIDAARSSLMERTSSGSLAVPEFADDLNGNIDEWLDRKWQKDLYAESPFPSANTSNPLENTERRERNLQWLRNQFRSLNEVGRLPFNNADLWQLHQYYFSPPFAANLESVNGSNCSNTIANDPSPRNIHPKEGDHYMGRSVSFQTLKNAFAGSSLTPNVHKRPQGDADVDNCPAPKKAKSLSKPRIGYYPRIMAKIQSLGTKPMEQSLSLLRQLRYMENIIFIGKDPYAELEDSNSEEQTHADVEMILLDLL